MDGVKVVKRPYKKGREKWRERAVKTKQTEGEK